MVRKLSISSISSGIIPVPMSDIAMTDLPVDSDQKVSGKYRKGENRRMVRNVIILSLSFTVLFTSYSGMSRLQSSINPGGGLGTYSQAAVYGGLILSSLFLPTFIIQKLSTKYALFFSSLGYLAYVGAQFYPSFYTLIPTALLVGICGAPLWAAKCIYLTKIGNEYAEFMGKSAELVIIRFFGIFFFSFQSAGIWGNLISTFVLQSGAKAVNTTRDISACGRTFCPADAQGGLVLSEISFSVRYTLAGIYVVIGLGSAALIILFLDSLKRYGEEKRGTMTKNSTEAILATLKQMKNPLQLLILPLTLWSGIEQGFVGADYYQAYVSCAWGVENLGYVGICYALCDSLASISFGPIIRHTGRIPVFILGAILDVSIIVLLFNWSPHPNSRIMFFVIAGVWGVADAVWQTQINAIYGVLFPDAEEAGFSNYRLWESIGFIIAYLNNNLICIETKLYLLLGVLAVGMTGYFIIEYIVRKRKSAGEK